MQTWVVMLQVGLLIGQSAFMRHSTHAVLIGSALSTKHFGVVPLQSLSAAQGTHKFLTGIPVTV